MNVEIIASTVVEMRPEDREWVTAHLADVADVSESNQWYIEKWVRDGDEPVIEVFPAKDGVQLTREGFTMDAPCVDTVVAVLDRYGFPRWEYDVEEDRLPGWIKMCEEHGVEYKHSDNEDILRMRVIIALRRANLLD